MCVTPILKSFVGVWYDIIKLNVEIVRLGKPDRCLIGGGQTAPSLFNSVPLIDRPPCIDLDGLKQVGIVVTASALIR